ncbi:hypothetical protein B0I37DRAFT_375831 [Chaetomium sp. MPI-CAGE-AT-0009]|nr:hypothetical protein B0I37DRAFT_375831 [Chaetomium sp. MPI-CAGE-AT-0009]
MAERCRYHHPHVVSSSARSTVRGTPSSVERIAIRVNFKSAQPPISTWDVGPNQKMTANIQYYPSFPGLVSARPGVDNPRGRASNPWSFQYRERSWDGIKHEVAATRQLERGVAKQPSNWRPFFDHASDDVDSESISLPSVSPGGDTSNQRQRGNRPRGLTMSRGGVGMYVQYQRVWSTWAGMAAFCQRSSCLTSPSFLAC